MNLANIALSESLVALQATPAAPVTAGLSDAILSAVANGIVITNREGVIIWVNPAFSTLTGYSQAEALGKNPRDLVRSGLVNPATYKELWDTILAGKVWQGELLNRRKNGTFYHEGQTITAVRDTSGSITHFIAIKSDETERFNAKTVAVVNEERYRQLFEYNPLPMWLYDMQTLGFLSVNEAAVQHYGYSRDEFAKMTIKDIQPPEDYDVAHFTHAKSQLPAINALHQLHLRKDGTVIHVEIVARPLEFQGCKAQLVLANDVTEKKVLEDKFLHIQRLESIGMLAAGIAHDLNNVLAPIVLATELLKDNENRSDELKTISTIAMSAARGAGLVKQILGFARIASGEYHPTQLKHLLRELSGIIEETFPKSIVFDANIPTDLWPVHGSAVQLYQLLLNLCVNARDAMPAGGHLLVNACNRRLDEAAALAVAPEGHPGAWVLVEVTDSGCGITPQVMEHLWEPFFTTKAVGKGTGLGLSTVRGIVTSHNGMINLQTKVGRGTTFRVYLPAIESATIDQSAAGIHDIRKGKGELIMIVDDDILIRESLSRLLEKRGYRTLCFKDGELALEYFRGKGMEIDLVLTDIDMPRLGGAALAADLRRMRPSLKIITMSGLSHIVSHDQDVADSHITADAFLKKPFNPVDLLVIVGKLLAM